VGQKLHHCIVMMYIKTLVVQKLCRLYNLKIMNGHYNINRDIFSALMKVVEEDMVRNCPRDLVLGSMHCVTESLIYGTYYQHMLY